MLGAGRDVTQLFDSYHKLEIIKLVLDKKKTIYCGLVMNSTLKKFYVGELVDNEMPVFPEMR